MFSVVFFLPKRLEVHYLFILAAGEGRDSELAAEETDI
jgi:hypothetical protein